MQNMTTAAQGSTSKIERQRHLNEILGQLKKGSSGTVTVKLSNKVNKLSSTSQALTPNTMASGKATAQRPGNSATRQYYAGSAGGPANASIDLSSQQHNASINNGSSSRAATYANTQGGPVTITASAFHPPSETDLNHQQLLNMEGNIVNIINTDGIEDSLEGYTGEHISPIVKPKMLRSGSTGSSRIKPAV